MAKNKNNKPVQTQKTVKPAEKPAEKPQNVK